MKKPRIYLDTSVVGGCEDEEFAEASRELLAQAQAGKLVLLVSDLLVGELARAPEAVRQRLAGSRRSAWNTSPRRRRPVHCETATWPPGSWGRRR